MYHTLSHLTSGGSFLRYSAILLIALLPSFSAGQTTNWIGGTSNWNNSSNWDSGIPLTSGYTAVINSSGNTITLDTSPTIDALNLTAGTLLNTAQTLTLAAPDTSTAPLSMATAVLNVNNDGTDTSNGALIFTLGAPASTYSATGGSGSIINVNSGSIAINDNGGGSTLSLTGGGQINLGYNGSSNVGATITGVTGDETLTTDFNISGQGTISGLALNLSGTVDSNAGLNGILTLQPSSGGLTNTGAISASDGALVLDTATNGGTITNHGTITVGLSSMDLYGMNGTTSLNNASDGMVNVNDGGTFYMLGTGAVNLQNDGAVNLNSVNDSTTLNLIGNGTTFSFNGTGSLNLSDSGGNQILGTTGGETLVNGAGHTLQGAGYIANLALTNNGTLSAGISGGSGTVNSLYILPTSGGFTNTGTVNVGTGGLTVDTSYGNVTNSSTGAINVNGGATLTIFSQGLGGTIQNSGAINLNYDSTIPASGNLALNSYSGTFTLSGNGTLSMADQAAAGTLSGVTGSETLVNGTGHTVNTAGTISGLSLINNGTLNVTGVNAATTFSNSDLINSGTVNVNGLGLVYNANGFEFNNTGIISVNSSSITVSDAGGFGQTIHNNGTIALSNSQMVFQNFPSSDSSFEFSGHGTLTLGGGSGSAIVGEVSGGGSVTLQNDASHTIQGNGSISGLTLENLGSLIASGGSLTVSSLGNYTSGTLKFGSYTSTAGSPLIVQNLGPIETIGTSTSVTLNGAGSLITADGSTDALASLSTNNGSLTLTGGRSLTLGGISTFTNTGTIEVDAGSTFDTSAGAFQSLDTSGNLSGKYNIGGTFQFAPQTGSNGVILTNNGSITLSGVGSLITADGSTDALSQLSTNNGSLTLIGGRSLTLSGISTFTNAGSIEVDAGSTLDTRLGAFQSLDTGGNLSGSYSVGGTFLFTPQSGGTALINTITSGSAVTLNGVGSLITADGSTDALSQLSNNSGSLTVTGGRSLTLSGITTYSNSGSLTVGAGSTFDTRGGAFQNVDTNGNLTGNYSIGGTFLYAPQAGAAGISSIDLTSTVTLSGTGQILYGAGPGTNALANLATINGTLVLGNAASLSVGGAVSNTFNGVLALNGASSFTANGSLTNTGFIYVDGAGTTLTAQGYNGGTESALSNAYSELSVTNGGTADLRSGSLGGFQNLVNNGGVGTLMDGVYIVGGTLKIDGADNGSGGALGINAIDASASLTLSGTGQILYGSGAGTNALAQLAQNSGLLALEKGATLAVSSFANTGSVAEVAIDGIGTNFTVNGNLLNGTNSVIQMTNGATMQVMGATTLNGGLVLDGFNTKFVGQGGLTVGSAGGVALSNDATADFRTAAGVNTFTNLGGGTLTSGGSLSDGVLNGGIYLIDGNFLYDPTSGGAGGQILAIGAGTELALTANAQVLTGAGSGSNALESLQENDGTFELLFGASASPSPATGTFENAAGASMLVETGSVFSSDMQNDGDVYIDPSSLIISAQYTQSGGTTTVDGTLLATTVSVTSGLLNGGGVVEGEVVQTGGTIQPGDAPGVLSIVGDYTEDSGGTLEIDFTGRSIPGSDWGQLFVGGVADLSGEIDVVLLNPIVFQLGDVFDILNAGSVVNDGVAFNLPGLPSGLAWDPVFQSGELDLDVEVSPEPETWAMMAIGVGLALWFGRRRLTV